MSGSGGFDISGSSDELARRGRQLMLNAWELDRSSIFSVSGSTVEKAARVGVNVAAYLAGRAARDPERASRDTLIIAALELWDPLPVPDDAELVYALSLATLISATTHDHVSVPSPRFVARAVLGMGLAAAADEAGDAWRRWWEDSVRLGEATEFDLGAVNSRALFWRRLLEADIDLSSPEWLRNVPPPSGASFERLERALDAVRYAAESQGKDVGPHTTDSEYFHLSPLPIAVGPRLDRDAPRRRVWFATNRETIPGPDGPEFTGEASMTTSFGSCEIELSGVSTVPPTPTSEFRLASISVAEDETAFVEDVRDHLATPGEPRRLLLLIHGYNTTFTQSALQAVQLAHDLGIEGEVALFSWPSAGKWYLYGRDAQRIDLGHPSLVKFLVCLTKQVGFERIDVIVHSLGNRLFATAAELAGPQGIRFGSVFLAAADVNFPRFEQVAPQITSLADDPVTVYVSRKDRALIASRLTFNQEARIGRGEPIAIADHVDTMDATDVRARDFWRHQYFSNTQTLLSDMAAQLRGELAPEERGDKPIEARTPENKRYWRFRKRRA